MTLEGPGKACVYCGAAAAETFDHVPPKNLFPRPRPSNLITVPCCEPCRKTQSKDDEYFRNMVIMRHDVAEVPAAGRILNTVHAALARPEARGLTTRIVRSVREVEIRTAAGLYLGQVASYTVDLRRLDAVVRRTLRGVYFHELGVRLLPETHETPVWGLAGLTNLDSENTAALQRLVEFSAGGAVRALGDRVCTYSWRAIDDAEDCSVWFFLFYGCVAFMGLTRRLDGQPLAKRS